MNKNIANETLKNLTDDELKRLQKYFEFMGYNILIDLVETKRELLDMAIYDDVVSSATKYTILNSYYEFEEITEDEVRKLISLAF